MEYSNTQLKEELKKNNKKLEENFKNNMNWEIHIKEIKNKLLKLEEEKNSYKEETDKWKTKVEDLEFQLSLYVDKEKIHQDNLANLKRLQKDYENSIEDLKREYKDKEDVLRKKNEIIIDNNFNKMKEQEKEFNSIINEHNTTIKNLEREIDKICEENNNHLNKIYLLNISLKEKENEFSEICKDKDKVIRETELKLKNLSNDAANHINRLNNSINDITTKILEFRDKEQFYQREVADIDYRLQDYIKKNNEYENTIEKLKNDNATLYKSQSNLSVQSVKDDMSREKDNDRANYIKKLEIEIIVISFK